VLQLLIQAQAATMPSPTSPHQAEAAVPLFEGERHKLATKWPISPIVAPPKTALITPLLSATVHGR
jgi:hypothetical protein